MIDDMREGADAFVETVSEVLRAEERAPADFTVRVMTDVRAIRSQITAQPRGPWLLRSRSLSVTPAAALALAAGLVLVFLGGMQLRRAPAVAAAMPAVAARVDTVHVVRFVLSDAQASSISLVGSFNQWEKSATPLRQVSPGVWSVQVSLAAGRHEYAFVVRDANGERWIADPASVSLSRDEFGAESSVIDLRSISTS
jgi:hypothetical protein